MEMKDKEEFISSLTFESQEYCEYFCQPCNQEGNHKEAEGYCENCREFLCLECYRVHRRPTALRHHTLLDKTNMKKHKPPTAAQDVITDRCLQHEGKLLEYFCSVHTTMACNACVILNHRNCDPMQFIPDLATDIQNSQEYKELNQILDTMIAKWQAVTMKSLQNTTLTDTINSTAIQDLKLFRKEINTVLDHFEKDVMKEVMSVRQSDKTRMKSITDNSSEKTAELQTIKSEIKHLRKDQKNCQLFVAMKKAKDHLDVQQAALHDLDTENNVTQYRFTPNQQILDVLKEPGGLGTISYDSYSKASLAASFGTSQMANVRISKKPRAGTSQMANVGISERASAGTSQMANVGISERKSVGTSQMATSPRTKAKISINEPDAAGTGHMITQVTQGPVPHESRHLKATFVTDIKVKSSTDNEDCYITGATLVGDIIVICDIRNCKVKLIDIQRHAFISEVRVSSKPWTVTQVDHNLVAVTLPYVQKIAFLQLTDKLKKEMKVNGKCNGIVYTNDMLVVSFIEPGKIELLDMQGNILHMIDTDSQGNQLFSKPEHIAIGPDGQSLYISDLGNQTVTCVTTDGTVKGVYKDSDLKYPSQLTVDTNGNVFVCGCVSNNIIVLNSQCQKVKVLLRWSDGLCYPVSLCYNRETCMLYVGMNGSNGMKMYQLT